MKDLFSTQSDQYAKYRPVYPPGLFAFINLLVESKHTAWDCATGNGQVASELAKSFEHVFATDISQSQIDNAATAPNVAYSVQPAEETSFENNSFDLITVGQAIHWFNFEKFYPEVNRVAKPGAILALIGYGRMKLNAEIDSVIDYFYEDIIGQYWDEERKYIDDQYQTLPFPYKELSSPDFEIQSTWSKEQFFGYLGTWSAVKKFIAAVKYDPLVNLKTEIGKYWEDGQLQRVVFPLLTKFARV